MHSLYSKLALVLLALFLVMGVVLLGVVRNSSEMYQQEVAQRLNASLAAQMAGEFPLITADQPNSAALEQLFHQLMIINPRIEVYLLSPEGRLLAYSAPAERIHRQQVDLGPIKTFLAGDYRWPLLGDDPRQADSGKVFSAAAIRHQGTLQGYLYVILASEAYTGIADALGQSYALRLGGWALVGSLGVALLAGLLIFAWLTRRLARLRNRLERLAPGSACQVRQGDELQQLEACFELMTTRIQGQLAELTEMDQQRREMVANVSHDLRTPLATLHGYLETLLIKHDEITPDQRLEYLRIAVRNSEDLSRLVTQLFELARLDAGDSTPHTEPFALDELIQDTLLKHRLSAQAQGVELRIDSGPGLSFVEADIGLIQRALDNLIDNALRHTPRGGSIAIDLTPSDGKIAVAITDTGCGIPANELPRVFERFYRRDKSREDGPAHAGLGLAIAKRILELHGGAIQANSTLGAGTTFSFSLPCPAGHLMQP